MYTNQSDATESEPQHDECGKLDCLFSLVICWLDLHDVPPLEAVGLLDIVKRRIIDSIEECSGKGEDEA